MLVKDNSFVNVKIYNAVGKKVLDKYYSSIEGYFSANFDTGKYPTGAYYIEIKTKNENLIKNIIIQNE